MKLLSSEDKKHPANRMPEGGKGKESKRGEESPSPLFLCFGYFCHITKGTSFIFSWKRYILFFLWERIPHAL